MVGSFLLVISRIYSGLGVESLALSVTFRVFFGVYLSLELRV